jgi:hypothetical protein
MYHLKEVLSTLHCIELMNTPLVIIHLNITSIKLIDYRNVTLYWENTDIGTIHF